MGSGGFVGGGPIGQPSPTPTTTAEQLSTSTPAPSYFIVIEGNTGTVGEIVDIPIVIKNLDNGISGYRMDVRVENSSVAQIVQVNLPPYGLTKVGDLPSSSVSITAVDLTGILDGMAASRVIATVNLNLLNTGETRILLNLIALDNDQGLDIKPFTSVEEGVLTVN